MESIVSAGFAAFIGGTIMVGVMTVAYAGLGVSGVAKPEALLTAMFFGQASPFVFLYFGALGGVLFAKQIAKEQSKKVSGNI